MRNFEKIARQLISDAQKNPLANRVALFKRLCPELVRQISGDSGRSGPLIFWGQCRNVDELAARVIVDPSILETIFQIAGRSYSPDYPHAGLQHTYGYLFSIIDTLFGRKRDRWIGTTLEHSLGLPSDLLGPAPSHGSLLANATWLAGSIAFRGHARRRWLERSLRQRVPSAIATLPVDNMTRLRETETVKLPHTFQRQARVSLITDLVQMPHADSERNRWLLVYSVEDERKFSPEIITLFTVSDTFVDSIRERAAQQQRKDIRLRYNAWVKGFPTEPQAGIVRLSEK